MNFVPPITNGTTTIVASMNHILASITIDGVGAKIDLKRPGLVARMHLLMAARDIVLTDA